MRSVILGILVTVAVPAAAFVVSDDRKWIMQIHIDTMTDRRSCVIQPVGPYFGKLSVVDANRPRASAKPRYPVVVWSPPGGVHFWTRRLDDAPPDKFEEEPGSAHERTIFLPTRGVRRVRARVITWLDTTEEVDLRLDGLSRAIRWCGEADARHREFMAHPPRPTN